MVGFYRSTRLTRLIPQEQQPHARNQGSVGALGIANIKGLTSLGDCGVNGR